MRQTDWFTASEAQVACFDKMIDGNMESSALIHNQFSDEHKI